MGPWVRPAARTPSMVAADRFRFLNEEHSIVACGDWDRPEIALLWRFNLHYFDDLNAQGAEQRRAWHRSLIERWIAENRSASSNAWAPYPTSLRIVNWIKWLLTDARNLASEAMLQSLATQLRCLERRLEFHLLGNHLLVNAKALVFGGLFFSGPEAVRWLRLGMRILEREVKEQVLEDGAQFELSPMYHSLALEDMLDLLNISRAFSHAVPTEHGSVQARWSELIGRMRRWLTLMCHPDGEISYFNDAAIGIAPAPAELERYAVRLELGPGIEPADGTTVLESSGYVRVQRNDQVALLDCAAVGPDYLPGHAHADTLSFELSIGRRRLIVNAGTSQYGVGAVRQAERSTSSHSTVQIDSADSSEVWGGFRVARRAFPFDLSIATCGDDWTVACSHDGYSRLPGRPIHRRTWSFRAAGKLTVSDQIQGNFRSAIARLLIAPGWHEAQSRAMRDSVCLDSPNEGSDPGIRIELGAKTPLSQVQAYWSPEFGVRTPICAYSYPVGADGALLSIGPG